MEWKSSWVVGTHSWMIATCVFLNMCLLICVVACGVFFVDRGLPGFHPLTLSDSMGCSVCTLRSGFSTLLMRYTGGRLGSLVCRSQYGLLYSASGYSSGYGCASCMCCGYFGCRLIFVVVVCCVGGVSVRVL